MPFYNDLYTRLDELIRENAQLAQSKNYTELLKSLNQNSWVLNESNNEYRSLISIAAKNGDEELANLLFKFASEQKPSMVLKLDNHFSMYDTAPLHEAVRAGHEKIIRWLVEHGANVNITNTYRPQDTPLHYAANLGNLKLMTYLVENGASVTAINFFWETVLMYAVSGKDLPAIQFILERVSQAHMDKFNYQGYSALHIAVIADSVGCARLLLESGATANVKTPTEPPLYFVKSAAMKNLLNSYISGSSNETKQALVSEQGIFAQPNQPPREGVKASAESKNSLTV